MAYDVITDLLKTTTNITNSNNRELQIEEAASLLKQAKLLIEKCEELIDLKDTTGNDDQVTNNPFYELSYSLKEIDASIEDTMDQFDAVLNICDLQVDNGDEITELFDINDTWIADPEIDDSESKEKVIEIDDGTDKPELPYTIKYAPQQPIVQGTKDLCCIRISWLGGGGDSSSSVYKAGNAVASNYERLSGGLFKFNVSFVAVKVPYTKSYRNVKAATAYAKNVADRNKKNGKYDWYAVFTGGAAGVSRAGGNTAMLRSPGSASHEVGHLIGFEHANRMVLQDQFKGRLDSTGQNDVELNLGLFKVDGSGDGSSIMSTFSSGQLTAPQLYSKGWLKEDQVAQHDLGSPPMVYNLQTLNSGPVDGYVKAVLIPSPRGENGRDLFLSAIHLKDKGKKEDRVALTLHLGNPSSIRVLTFGSQPTTVLGHTFEALTHDGNYFTVKISPYSPKPKP